MKRKIKLIVISGLVALFVQSIVLSALVVITPKKSLAAPGDGVAATYGVPLNADQRPNFTASQIESAVWKNANQIDVKFKNGIVVKFLPKNKGGGHTELYDQRLLGKFGNDGKVEYASPDVGCYAQINADLNESKSSTDFVMTTITEATFDFDFKPVAGGECVNSVDNPKIKLGSPELSTAYFKWIDKGRIETADGKTLDGGFTRASDNGFIYERDAEKGVSCRDKVVVTKATVNGNETLGNTLKFYELDSNYTGNPPPEAAAGSCDYNEAEKAFLPSNVEIPIANPENKEIDAGQGVSTTQQGEADDGASCESSGFILGWITCGIIAALSGIVQGIFTAVIEPYLKVTPIDTTADSANSIFKVWSSIRNIANIVLLFALLFVVFGQAVGGGLIDAYTAKKIIPRLLAAAILVNISIYLVAILVDIFNIIGNGIGNLLLGPFRGTTFSKFDNKGANETVIWTVLLTAIVGVIVVALSSIFKSRGGYAGNATWATVTPFLHFILVFVLLPGALITLAIFATLIIRQGLILILVVTAPLAFAFFAIPNTEKYFKKWWSTLTTTLLVYPIMTIIFSTSIILAALSYNNVDAADGVVGGLGGFIGVLVSFIILIVPLALIPFSFKIAGGLIGNVLNSARGVGNRLTAPAQNKYKEHKGLINKSKFEDKWRNPDYGPRRSYEASREGKRRVWGATRDRIAGSGAGTRQNVASGGGNTQEAMNAGNVVATELQTAGANSSEVAAARQAAISAYTQNVGAHGHAAATSAARAAGQASRIQGITQQGVANSGSAAAQAYTDAIGQGWRSESAETAAGTAGSVAARGASAQASRTAGLTSGQAHHDFTNSGIDQGAARTLAEAVGTSSARIHDTTAQANGGDHAAAQNDATRAANAMGSAARQSYDTVRGRGETIDAAITSITATEQASMRLDATGARLSGGQLMQAAELAGTTHTSAEASGATVDQARNAGLAAALRIP